jgi:hypothetical protein
MTWDHSVHALCLVKYRYIIASLVCWPYQKSTQPVCLRLCTGRILWLNYYVVLATTLSQRLIGGGGGGVAGKTSPPSLNISSVQTPFHL